MTEMITFRKADCSIIAKNMFCDPAEAVMAACTPTTVIQIVANIYGERHKAKQGETRQGIVS